MIDYSMNCLPTEMFIDPIDLDEFICILCYGVMRHPVVDPCRHKYNRECLAKWLNEGGFCPMSKNPLSLEDVVPSQNAVEMFPSVRTKCAYFTKCEWSGTFDRLYQHLEQDCLYEPVIHFCSNMGCPIESLPRIDIKTHDRECEARPMQCTGCDAKFTFSETSEHLDRCPCIKKLCPSNCGQYIRPDDTEHEFHCLAIKFRCPFSKMGCAESISRREVLSHCFEGGRAKHHLFLALEHFVEESESVAKSAKMAVEAAQEFSAQLEKNILFAAIADQKIKPTLSPIGNSKKASPGHSSSSVIVSKTTEKAVGSIVLLDRSKFFPFDKKMFRWPISKLYKRLILYWIMQDTWICQTILCERKVAELRLDPSLLTNSLDWQYLQRQDGEETQTEMHSTHPSQTLIEEYETVKFSTKYSLGPIKIVDGRLITRVDSIANKGGLILQTNPLTPFHMYKFWFDENSETAKIGFGICKQQTVSQNGYSIPEDKDHGCYIVFRNGDMLVNGDSRRLKGNLPVLTRESKSIVNFYYDSFDRMLHFIDFEWKRIRSIDLSSEDDLSGYYPCVFMAMPDIITPREYIANFCGNGLSSFSPLFRSPHLALYRESAFFAKEAIGFLDWRVKSGKPYRFLIEQRNSETMGFCIELCDSLDESPYFIQKPKHWTFGRLMANGRDIGLESIEDDQGDEGVTFKTGDVVELAYDYPENRLTFSNLTRGIRIQRRLDPEKIAREKALVVGVLLEREGDSVRILSD